MKAKSWIAVVTATGGFLWAVALAGVLVGLQAFEHWNAVVTTAVFGGSYGVLTILLCLWSMHVTRTIRKFNAIASGTLPDFRRGGPLRLAIGKNAFYKRLAIFFSIPFFIYESTRSVAAALILGCNSYPSCADTLRPQGLAGYEGYLVLYGLLGTPIFALTIIAIIVTLARSA